MIHSMTGFGNADVALSGQQVHISIKCVNSKTADVSIRLPQEFREGENHIRAALTDRLKRGKIDFSLNLESGQDEAAHKINAKVLKDYMEQMREITSDMDDLEDDDLLGIVSRFPNILSQEKAKGDDQAWNTLMTGVNQAIDQVEVFRQEEGRKLENDLKDRIASIQELKSAIAALEKERTEVVREKLSRQLEKLELKEGVDKDRFEQELIYYLERLDITEEQVRLDAHLQLFMDTMSEEGGQGKKLGFISQEIGREINTIGSKANHAGIQKLVVGMKDELEKIKEQLFNIL